MGSLAAVAMAGDNPSLSSAMPKPVHPFFTQARVQPPTTAATTVTTTTTTTATTTRPTESDPPTPDPSEKDAAADATPNSKVQDAGTGSGARRGRRRKADDEPQDETTNKQPQKKRTRSSAGGDIISHFAKLAQGNGDTKACPEDNAANVSTPSTLIPEIEEILKGHQPADDTTHPSPVGESNAQPNGAPPETLQRPSTTNETTNSKPIKLLIFNPKTGTIGSPPKPKQPSPADSNTNIDKSHSSKRQKKPAKIVRIRYASDEEARARLGKLIGDILDGRVRYPMDNSKPHHGPLNAAQPTQPAPETKPPAPPKAMHPFFASRAKKSDRPPESPKAKKTSTSPLTARTIVYWSTPISPKKPKAAPTPKGLMPQFGVKNFGLKFPGSKLPAWPWQGMVHIRGDAGETVPVVNEPLPLPSRKSKGHAVTVAPGKTVIHRLARNVDIAAIAKSVKEVNTEDFIPPPPEVRLPQKHFESGRKLQKRILPELVTFKPFSHRQSAQGSDTSELQPPPQLARLFNSISTSLSAFDMSQCETANWVQKYAPINAVEVLQPGHEAFFLRDWLRALMVQSVDTGSTEADKSKGSAKGKGAGGGKKKRRKKLDGFIVSSEDEDYELYELSEQGEDWAPSGSRGVIRKTVVRSGKLSRENTLNTLIISGPPGCGKTAAVYAVAKELDFEVFEINASSRRSGKDVLERIGDMTRNHHVQQHQADGNQDAQPTEDDTAKDIKAGKQATMNAFFKAKPKGPKPAISTPKPATKSSPKEGKKEASKSQRQSLILLEEVDILYEEDKLFWTTIVGLIAQAKRPFIMTCNDETLLPFHMLQLHGIFRLSPPPKDLAVDRLLLIAANEGHALSRHAVEQLYDSRNHDLRAATMDLQYWCQIGVGDRRGGFDWFIPRWPKGVDVDQDGDIIRVISQDTYLPGMNLFSRDQLVDPKTPARLVEEEILQQSWDFWGFDMGHWQDSIGLTSWAESLTSTSATGDGALRLHNLEVYCTFSEALSVADIFSQGSFATFKEEAIDTTQPETSAKAQDDLILGVTHLNTPIVADYDNLTMLMPNSIKSLAKNTLLSYTNRILPASVQSLEPLNENQAIQVLQHWFVTPLPSAPRINRMDFAFAFDPIAASDVAPQPLSYLDPSVFDRNLKLIALDVAPFVRSIVAYDCRLQRQRLKMSSLMSQGGSGPGTTKRMRTTRSSLSALEGRSRTSARGERWFKADLNPYLVAKTAGKGWNAAAGFGDEDVDDKKTDEDDLSSAETSAETKATAKQCLMKGKKRTSNVLLEEDDELGL